MPKFSIFLTHRTSTTTSFRLPAARPAPTPQPLKKRIIQIRMWTQPIQAKAKETWVHSYTYFVFVLFVFPICIRVRILYLYFVFAFLISFLYLYLYFVTVGKNCHVARDDDANENSWSKETTERFTIAVMMMLMMIGMMMATTRIRIRKITLRLY